MSHFKIFRLKQAKTQYLMYNIIMRYGRLPLHNPNRVFFIGDIHGDFHRLQRLWSNLMEDFKEGDHIVFLGDLVNRLGLYSAEILEFIQEKKQEYPGQIFLIEGNHDWMFKDWLVNNNPIWMKQYGQNTIQSFVRKYNLPPDNDEIRDHLEIIGVLKLLEEMLPYYESELVIATHAPLNRVNLIMHGLLDYEEDWEDGKEPSRFLLDRVLYDIKWGFCAEEEKISEIKKTLVCGHQFKHHKQPRLFKDRAFVDVGCGAVENRPLVAVMIPGNKVYKSE